MTPKVSFITGVKNRPQELKEMIQSLIDQDLTDWEAIIVDDHSNCPIEAVIDSFKDLRLHYHQLPFDQTGISNARNFAINKAKSEILLMADGDDINLSNRASVTYNLMTKNHYDLFYSNILYYQPETHTEKPFGFQPFNENLLEMFNFIATAGAAVRKSVLIKAGGFDPSFKLFEDYDLWIRMVKIGAKVGYTPEVLAKYRRSRGSVTMNPNTPSHETIMRLRIKNDVPPVNIEEIKNYAITFIIDKVLTDQGRAIWRDDRYKEK